jgi:hypothetical protein
MSTIPQAPPRQVDPFLWTHEAQPHIFDISSMLRPGSIRDQVVRGRLIVRRAIEAGLITTAKPMLVVGAGAAGAAAALEAVANGVQVVLIDHWRKPFRRQRGCITRRVDPTLYDWPAVHWHRTGYPWLPAESAPLPIMPGTAREIALAWDARLSAAVSTRPLLTWKPRTMIDMVSDLAGEMRAVRLSDGSIGAYGMIVLARGPGKEAVQVDNTTFCSYAFWDTDRITRGRLDGRAVLISGGGDGALQDFLRCVLAPRTDLRRLLLMLDVPVALQQQLHALNDLSSADFVWSGHARHEHHADAFLHREYTEIVRAFWTAQSGRIIPLLQSSVRASTVAVTLAHPCGHFSRAYPVNRFLTLLLVHYFQNTAAETTRPDVRVVDQSYLSSIVCDHPVKSAPHRRICFARPHRVQFATGTCYDDPRTLIARPPVESFDVVVLRHGVRHDPAQPGVIDPLPKGRAPEKNPRQVLPPHLAHLSF